MKLTLARRNDLIMAAVILAVIVADQLTKYWIVQYFRIPYLRPPIPLLGAILELEYVQNTGVAFSLLQGQALLFLFIAIAIVVLGSLFWRLRDTSSPLLKVTFGLILGGALGNLLDRFRHTYVVDFIHFHIPGHFDFAVFNVADSAISIGVVALACLLWFGIPHETSAERISADTSAAHEHQDTLSADAASRPARQPDARSSAVPRVRSTRLRAK